MHARSQAIIHLDHRGLERSSRFGLKALLELVAILDTEDERICVFNGERIADAQALLDPDPLLAQRTIGCGTRVALDIGVIGE